MSAELALEPRASGVLADPRARHVLRYAVGATVAMGIAMGIAWPLAFLVPVLSLSFLASPEPPPTLRKGVMFVATIAVASVAGLWAIKYLIGIPALFFGGFALLLLRVFYAANSGAPPFLMLWLLIALLLLPMIAVISPDIAVLVVQSLTGGAALSVLVGWMAHGLIPDPREAAVAAAKTATPLAPARERLATALLQVAVVFPVFVLFHLMEWAGSLLVLIFVALFSLQPAVAANFKAGSAMILGNLIGGIAAIASYQLLMVVPEFPFLLLLCLLAGLFFGNRLLGGGKKAPLFGMAYSTMLLILGTTTSSDGDATSAVYTRIFQMTVAVTYVVFAFGFLNRVRAARR
jgi:hypothetical protein